MSIRAWFLKRRLAAPRKYFDSLRQSSWRLGVVPEEARSETVLTSSDRDILAHLDRVIEGTRAMKRPYDALDLAEALLIKGFIFRIRGVDLGGMCGAWGQFNDSVKVCRSLLNQIPSAEAADVLSQAALHLSETQLAIAEDDDALTEIREEAKGDANRYLEECIEWSQQLENEDRANAAKQLLARLRLLGQRTLACPRCKKLFERPTAKIPKDAISKKLHDGKPVAEVMKCRSCGIMYCWPDCCELEPCVCGSTQGFVSKAVHVASR